MKKLLYYFFTLLTLFILFSAYNTTKTAPLKDQDDANTEFNKVNIQKNQIEQQPLDKMVETSTEETKNTNPPEISISTMNTVIPYIIGLNCWNGLKYDRLGTFQMYMEEYQGNNIPSLALGTEIAIEFADQVPNQYELKEYILDKQGEMKYSDREIKDIPLEFKDGIGVFELSTNIAASLSSNSEDYEPGNSIRGFILTCIWDENECEYGFIIKSDAN